VTLLASQTLGASTEPPDEADDERAAMLSVYYHALGRTLELRGAPAVLMPAEVEPLLLGEALETLQRKPRLFHRALWTVARGLPPEGGRAPITLARYPAELRDIVTSTGDHGRLLEFEEMRRDYRRDAHQFGEALAFFEQEDGGQPGDLRPYIDSLRTSRFSNGVQLVGALGRSKGKAHNAATFLEDLARKRRDGRSRAATQLRRLSEEMGLPLQTFMEEFSYAVAFADAFRVSKTSPTGDRNLTIFPASSVTVQDARSLITTITVSALVRTEKLSCLSIGLDPQCWMKCSHSFEHSNYLDINDVTIRRPRTERNIGRSYSVPKQRLLEERVRIAWGISKQELGYFHNLLNITKFSVRRAPQAAITLEFDLHRSLSSRILWDVRPGGILLDEGYARARQITDDLFRVTVRKTLRFSDRTPSTGGTGWHDLGQVLNFLAPAAMCWWLENEMYNQDCPEIIQLALKREPDESAPAGKETG